MFTMSKNDSFAFVPLFAVVGLVTLALFGTGCTSGSSNVAEGAAGQGAAAGASGRDRYAVAVGRAPFYKNGPAQGYGPDASFVQGTIVQMLERKFGYSRVTTIYGDGWMATSDLEPAPPEEPEPYTFAEAPTHASTSHDNADYAPPEEMPLPEPEPEPEPLPDPTIPQPDFRY